MIAAEPAGSAAANITRRLAAIAFADVVGWSRLMEQQDQATAQAWMTLRQEVIEPKIAEHDGTLLERQGDAVLVEFRSAVSAVRWAMDLQQALAARRAVAGAVAFEMRIGINVEDAIVDEGKLLGDGVNVASRIHQIAQPGEIVVTEVVRDFLVNKIEVSLIDLGERRLKNIGRPVRIFRVDSEAVVVEQRVPQPRLLWSTRPTLAVLPFRTLGGTEEERYFGEGITEDIIGALARSRSVFVIARSSTLRYRDRPMDTREIASELGVRYVLDGSVWRKVERLRINAELIDATENQTLWARPFVGANDEIFEFQERIAASIVGALEPRLFEVETDRVRGRPTESLDAYDSMLRGLALLYTFRDNDFEQAGQLFVRATELDPSFARAFANLAWWYNFRHGEGRSADPDSDKAASVAAAERALQLDPNDAFVLAVAGHIDAFVRRRIDHAIELFDRALALNENSAFAWAVSAPTYSYAGRPEEALERLRNAWRLSPFDPLNFKYWTSAGIAEFVAGRHNEAIGWLQRARRANARFLACNRILAAALALAGDSDSVQPVVDDLLAVQPGFRISAFAAWYPVQPAVMQRLVEGLRKAGLPE